MSTGLFAIFSWGVAFMLLLYLTQPRGEHEKVKPNQNLVFICGIMFIVALSTTVANAQNPTMTKEQMFIKFEEKYSVFAVELPKKMALEKRHGDFKVVMETVPQARVQVVVKSPELKKHRVNHYTANSKGKVKITLGSLPFAEFKVTSSKDEVKKSITGSYYEYYIGDSGKRVYLNHDVQLAFDEDEQEDSESSSSETAKSSSEGDSVTSSSTSSSEKASENSEPTQQNSSTSQSSRYSQSQNQQASNSSHSGVTNGYRTGGGSSYEYKPVPSTTESEMVYVSPQIHGRYHKDPNCVGLLKYGSTVQKMTLAQAQAAGYRAYCSYERYGR
jgi:hypothetical protein